MRERGVHLEPAALLALLRWVSPTLPVGAYAYSRGLEQAVCAGWVHDEASALAWIDGVLEHGIAQLDGPVLARLHAAFCAHDVDALGAWNRLLAANRESRELALEDEQMGMAFARIMRTEEGGEPWPCAEPPSYVTMFARACARSLVPVRTALLGLFWATAEGQTSAAVRLVPLGQSAAQRILAALTPRLARLVDHALSLGDDELGAALPALALASARHETQYTRLFRS